MRKRSHRKRSKRSNKTWKPVTLLAMAAVGYVVYGVRVKPREPMNVGQKVVETKPDPMVAFHGKVKPLLETYCFDCHGDGSHKGGLDFDEYPTLTAMTSDREKWLKVKEHLSLQLMPPLDEDQPKEQERKQLVSWIDNAIFPTNPDDPDPGIVVMRRLNRNEYKNTVRDLLGAEINVETLLPLDDTGYGFDTIAEVHTVSSAHIEKYLNAAEIALSQALVIGKQPFKERIYPSNEFTIEGRRKGDAFRYSINGFSSLKPQLEDGQYKLVVQASSSQAGDEDAVMAVKLDGQIVKKFTIAHGGGGEAQLVVAEITLPLIKSSKIEIGFINDFYDPRSRNKHLRDRNLFIHEVKMTGPVDRARPEKPASHLAVFPHKTVAQTNESYALEVWQKFAQRAFRRPVAVREILPYKKFLEPLDSPSSREDLEAQIMLGLQAMLVSPEFLYIQNTPLSNSGEKSLLTEHALAARLSYFLWSTMPDARLLELADGGQLRKQLSSEIDRMLDSPRSEQFVKHFSGQWLQLRSLKVHTADTQLYPMWNKQLRQDAVKETQLFLSHLIQHNLSAKECLDADYSFLNRNLAKHYGVRGVQGGEFRKVTFPDDRRGGLLGHASILTLTSNPNRTSPVLRGKWILDNILGTPPPPPPADIPELQPEEKENLHASLRSQLELHRKKAACASCHNLMDPLGFALENFDAVGRWRDRDNGNKIDNHGVLISGESFSGSGELRDVLLSHKVEPFIRCLSEKLLTYSIGRGVEYYDKPAIDKIIKKSESKDHSLRAIIHAVCESVPFQQTRTP